MNYTYEVEIFSNGGFRRTQPIIKECKDKEILNSWSLLTLLNSSNKFGSQFSSSFQASLIRTKKWLKDNHPEISMKFMIFKDGVYDANYQGADSVLFWKFSELNNLDIINQDWKILSFKKTKMWIIENHPEMLI